MLIFCYPIIINPNLMPGDLGDARFINYVLEHGYLFLQHNEIHSKFWDMPFFYPAKNTLAYSDILLGGMFLYVPFRFLKTDAQTSLQLVYIISNILNFTTFYYLCKKFKFSNIISGFLSFFFAFNIFRHNQLCHIQNFFQFYMILSIIFLLNIKEKNDTKINKIWFSLSFLMFIIQIYTTFYFGWFMLFGSAVTAITLLLYKKTRYKFISKIKYFYKNFKIIFILLSFLLLPLIIHYLMVPLHSFNKIDLIRFIGLFENESLFDSLFFYLGNFADDTSFNIGYISTFVILISIFKSKYKKLYLTIILIILSVFIIEPIHNLACLIFPGTGAIRATIRINFLLIPVYLFILGEYLKSISNKKILFWTIILLLTVEQIPYKSNFKWTKQEHINRIEKYNVPKENKLIFLYFTKPANISEYTYTAIDSMYLSNKYNKPTINGYSGYMPKNQNISIPENWMIKYKY